MYPYSPPPTSQQVIADDVLESLLVWALTTEIEGGLACRLPYCNAVIEGGAQGVIDHYWTDHRAETLTAGGGAASALFYLLQAQGRRASYRHG